MRRLIGTALAALVLIGAIGCGSSSKSSTTTTVTTTTTAPAPLSPQVARADGEALGTAAKDLVDARSLPEIASAVAALDMALTTARNDVKGEGVPVNREVRADTKRITDDVDAVKTAVGSGDVTTLLSAGTRLASDAQGLAAQVKTLATSGSAQARAFWAGVQDGYESG